MINVELELERIAQKLASDLQEYKINRIKAFQQGKLQFEGRTVKAE